MIFKLKEGFPLYDARPSHKELTKRIKEGLEAAHENRIEVINPESLAKDALELGYDVDDELQIVLLELLNETAPENYDGGRPPQKAYEKKIKGNELVAFALKIDRFEPNVYYKYTMKNSILWLVSLHEERK